MQKTRGLYVLSFGIMQFLVACGDPSADYLTSPQDVSADAIINGRPSEAGEYPSAGALLYKVRRNSPDYAMLCSGTLIAPDVVLTAGHCKVSSAAKFYFTLSRDVTSLDDDATTLPAESYEVASLVRHPDFDIPWEDGLQHANDFALAFLKKSIKNSKPAVMLATAEADVLKAGAPVTIVGYGLRSAPEENPDAHDYGIKTQAISVLNEVGDFEMQIGKMLPTPQKCFGDSGGPSYIDVPAGSRLIGVTSRAYDSHGCTKGGIDERADTVRAWIESAMETACKAGNRDASCPKLP